MRKLALLLSLFIIALPWLAFGQETAEVTISMPPAPPVMSKGEWSALVLAGSGYVFMIVELAKKNVPTLKGWWVWLAMLPTVAGVAVYQVGISEPLLLAKHAGLLLLTAVGGRAGLLKIFEYAVRAWTAYQAGQSIPPPPEPAPGGPISVPPASKVPQ